jgi:hypothetical protein
VQPPLPVEIPRAQAAPAEIVQQIARVAKQVEDPKQRYQLLSASFWPVSRLPQHELEPIVRLLEEAAERIDDDRFFISYLESLIAAAPESAAARALRIKDPAWRDKHLADVVRGLAAAKPRGAGELIGQIQNPSHRAQAMAALAQGGSLDYDETTALLAGAATADRPHQQPLAYVYADSLVRFAVSRPQEVAEFVASHLKPEDATWAFCRLGGLLLDERHAPEAARIMLDRAAAIVPRAPHPHKLVPYVIQGGYGRLRPKEALEMFNRLVLPKLREEQGDYDHYLASLGAIDVETMIKRAGSFAADISSPGTEVVAAVVCRAVHEIGPAPVFAWVKSTPVGPIRDTVVRSMPWGVAGEGSRFPVGNISPQEVRQYLQMIEDAVRAIPDPKVRGQAYLWILAEAEIAGMPPPEWVQDEFRRLWETFKDELDEEDWLDIRHGPFGALPEHAQSGHIRHWLKTEAGGDRFSVGADLLRRSTLPAAEKRKLYREFIDEARGDRTALSYLARSIAPLDLSWALELIWSVLPAVRRVDCPPDGPPENADAAVRWLLSDDARVRVSFQGALAKSDAAATLWSFAKTVPDVDRDGVLQELARVLMHHQRLDEALGVARLIEDRQVQAVLSAEIAAELNRPRGAR